jgi:hypothetical protein
MSIDPEFAIRLLVGNLSYLLLIISMTMTRIVPLRMVAIGSGVSGASYDFFWLADPVGSVWEIIFTFVNIIQVTLIAYRSAVTRFTNDELAFNRAIVPDLSPVQARHLLRTGSWFDADPGRELIRQGSAASHLIFLRFGQADIYVDGKLVGICQPGSLIGEISISTAGLASATVMATTPVHYLALERTALHRAMKADSAIARAIERGIRQSLQEKLVRMNEAAVQKLD